MPALFICNPHIILLCAVFIEATFLGSAPAQ